MFKPLVDIRARIYDMAHDPDKADLMTYEEDGEKFAIGLKLPYSQEDWWQKRRATDAVFEDVNGVITRVGDETAVHRNFYWEGPLRFVHKAAGLSDNCLKERAPGDADSTIAKWFANHSPMLPQDLDAA